MTKVDEIVRKRLSAYLAEKLKADVSIEHLSFNDKQLNISNLIIIDSVGTYRFSIKQIYVEYNLLKLLFSKFKNLHAVKNIKIYEPDISLEIFLNDEKVPDKEKKNFEIPELKDFFKKLDVNEGKFSLDYANDVLKFHADKCGLKPNWFRGESGTERATNDLLEGPIIIDDSDDSLLQLPHAPSKIGGVVSKRWVEAAIHDAMLSDDNPRKIDAVATAPICKESWTKFSRRFTMYASYILF